MAKKPEPILTVDLGENGGKIVFRSIEEIEAWINRETEFWAWIGSVPQHDIINQAWLRINNVLGQIRTQTQNARNHQQQPAFGGFIDPIKSLLQTYYSPSPQMVLHSTAPIAKHADKLRLSSPIVAAFLVADSMNCTWEPARNQFIHGVIEGALFAHGYRSNVEPEKTALSELKAEWQKLLQLAVDESTDIQNRFEAVLAKTEELHGQQEKAHSEIVTKHESAFNSELARSKSELENITRTYEEKLKLQAPVKYWAKKQTRHFWMSVLFGFVSILGMLAGALYIVSELHNLLADLKQNETPPYWKLGGLFVVATLSVWFVRILVRIFLSHVHLGSDAAERVTMVQTYLALVRRGQGPKDEDRQLILQTLFRPAVTGIVKDDAAPASVMEWLTRSSGRN